MKESKLSIAFRELIATLKPMSWRQRIDHIWSYYKEVLIIGLFVIILLAAILNNALMPRPDVRMSGYLANINLSKGGETFLTTDYLAHLQGDPEHEEVLLGVTSFGGEGYLGDMEANYNAALAPVLQVTAQEVDYFLMDQIALEFYLSKAFFADLSELLSEQELKQLEDRLTYYQPVDKNDAPVGDPIPVAIDLTDTAFGKTYAPNTKQIYFSVVANAPNRDTVVDLWHYIWDLTAEDIGK